MHVNITISFPGQYVAHPYWPELEKVINIQKESGVNRARSEAKRKQALTDYLTSHDLTVDDYEALKRKAERPFYTWADINLEVNGRDPAGIVIPAHQMYGALAEAASLASSSVRIARVDQLRSVITLSDFGTEKTGSDGNWERYVTVKSGTGQTLSNQRSLRVNQYIAGFDAVGSVRFSEDVLDPRKVHDFLTFTGREVGVGASRKMGRGRFDISRWEETQ